MKFTTDIVEKILLFTSQMFLNQATPHDREKKNPLTSKDAKG